MEFIKKYLSADPLPWLLEPSDQVILYLVKRDLLNQCTESDYVELVRSKAIAQLLQKSKGNILGYGNRFDLYYRGALWYLCEIVEYGLDIRSAEIKKTAAFLIDESQLDSGGFSLSWKPAVESALYTGEIVRVLIQAGIKDVGIVQGIQWLLDHQRHDGGWLYWPVGGLLDMFRFFFFNKPGKGLERESDTFIPSCPYASLACARALSLYNRYESSLQLTESINRAAEFFLEKRLYNFDNKPLYNSRLKSYQDFTRLGYPVLGQYDILSGLVFITEAGYFNDPRAADAFNIIMGKQNDDGTWNSESYNTGMVRKDASGNKKDGASKWVTLNVLRMLKEAGKY